jgi:hypothetical protein
MQVSKLNPIAEPFTPQSATASKSHLRKDLSLESDESNLNNTTAATTPRTTCRWSDEVMTAAKDARHGDTVVSLKIDKVLEKNEGTQAAQIEVGETEPRSGGSHAAPVLHKNALGEGEGEEKTDDDANLNHPPSPSVGPADDA